MTAIVLNGEPTDLAAGTTVAQLVAAHRPTARGIAVARNEEVVPRSEWPTVVLAEGDRLEILTAAQGG